MKEVVIHNKREPLLSFNSSSNRIVIYHVEPRLSVTGTNKLSTKNKTIKKVKTFIYDRIVTVKQQSNKKHMKAVR